VTLENECDRPAEIAGVWLRVGDNPAPDCALEYERCLDGVPPEDDASGCSETLAMCEGTCDRTLEECLGSADSVPEDCETQATACRDSCQEEARSCRAIFCEELVARCDEVPFAEPQGFAVLHGSLPIEVPSGATRSVVVTFAPLVPGPAEDALLIEVVSPEVERRPITLTGTGVSG
jgi:hypothetical protein